MTFPPPNIVRWVNRDAVPSEDLADELESALREIRPKRIFGTSPRSSILADASALIDGDRTAEYGPPTENLKRIAAMWGAYLDQPVTARDVAWLMVLLKVAREVQGHSRDSAVDAAGYAAIAHEVAGCE